MNNKQGFTIIELLIVIVVIGVIAGLVTTGIRSIRDRAENVKTSDGIAVYAKALISYAQDKGQYPDADAGGGSGIGCLGEDYPDLNNDGIGDCFRVGSYTTSESSYPSDELKEYLGDNVPSISDSPVTELASGQIWQPGHYRVGLFRFSSGSPELHRIIRYALEGEQQDCNQSPLIEFTSSDTFVEVTNRNYSRSYGGITFCDLYLRPV